MGPVLETSMRNSLGNSLLTSKTFRVGFSWRIWTQCHSLIQTSPVIRKPCRIPKVGSWTLALWRIIKIQCSRRKMSPSPVSKRLLIPWLLWTCKETEGNGLTKMMLTNSSQWPLAISGIHEGNLELETYHGSVKTISSILNCYCIYTLEHELLLL